MDIQEVKENYVKKLDVITEINKQLNSGRGKKKSLERIKEKLCGDYIEKLLRERGA